MEVHGPNTFSEIELRKPRMMTRDCLHHFVAHNGIGSGKSDHFWIWSIICEVWIKCFGVHSQRDNVLTVSHRPSIPLMSVIQHSSL